MAIGCGESARETNTNSAGNSNQRAAGPGTSSAAPSTSQFLSVDIKEPDRYSLGLTISIQETGSDVPAPMLTQQFELARLDADRRWSFVLPAPLGQVVYLEKSGLRYLVLFDRKQYTELTPNSFGFEPGKVFMPNAIAERLRQHQYEKLGLEPVNGRTATKYRLTSANDGQTHMIFVDQETDLALRSELNTASRSGAKTRVIVEARVNQLNPDRAQFDVPAGMKKVTQQVARQQIEDFANALRTFADLISGSQTSPVAGAVQSANKNSAPAGKSTPTR
jgi:hypothetical protein